MNAQRVGHEQEVAEFHFGAGFHALDRGSVDPGAVRQDFLGHVLVDSSHSDAVACRAAGIEDPLGLFGWHADNRLRTMIISQQQE